MTIKMHAPQYPSKHVKELGFDPESGTLAVTFAKGGTYYYDSDEDMYMGLHTAASPGQFVHQNIRGKLNPRSR